MREIKKALINSMMYVFMKLMETDKRVQFFIGILKQNGKQKNDLLMKQSFVKKNLILIMILLMKIYVTLKFTITLIQKIKYESIFGLIDFMINISILCIA